MKPHRALFGCLVFAICTFAVAGEFQPVGAGTTSLRERLAVVKSESLSLRTALETSTPTEAKKAEMSKRLADLDAEDKQLTSEIESAKEQSRSPYVTYAAPAQETK
jgi:hypothetical protein